MVILVRDIHLDGHEAHDGGLHVHEELHPWGSSWQRSEPWPWKVSHQDALPLGLHFEVLGSGKAPNTWVLIGCIKTHV